ncbi:hypothetical protein PVIIG_06102 [Plasmodium vivax India VII]|uniref:VIR protein n=1 Tax=Plasmodium vivax India VII TaxID=1077284 RepID=A0A0J9S5P8_PLAVI|nr:hypothetical protein PVIIG_06102 [Plasmodium vivax India VII]
MLPSEKIYKEYSKSIVNLDNSTKCADLTIDLSQHQDIVKLCDRLIEHLNYFNTKNKNDQTVKYNCEYLHYWMNDRVINELKVIDDAQYIAKITKLYIAWINIKDMLNKSKYICEPNRGPLISLPVQEFEFRKEMYDYYYNYVKFKDRDYSNINDCEMCKYLNYIYEKYKTFKSACSPSTHNKCVPELDNFDNYDPIKLFGELGCKNQGECNRNEELVPAQNLDGTQVAEVRMQDQTVGNNTQDSMNNSNRMTILNVALPASVFFVLFPMLYKMTPLGSRFGKANKIRNNIINDLKYEEGDSFLTHPFKQESMNNSDKTYNISYNNT